MSIGGHHSHAPLKEEWLTPPDLLAQLGKFDLDPFSPKNPPWGIAEHTISLPDDGFTARWFGRVWCNPPYGYKTGKALEKCHQHGNAIALVFARTETEDWFKHIWPKADAVLFIRKRLHFYHVDGTRAVNNSGGPSALVAYGENNATTLELCNIPGKYIPLQ